MKENGVVQSYLNYFGCLLFGAYIVDTIIPNPANEGIFDAFLLAGARIYTGALLGSSFYKLYFEKHQKCVYCNDGDSDSEGDE